MMVARCAVFVPRIPATVAIIALVATSRLLIPRKLLNQQTW